MFFLVVNLGQVNRIFPPSTPFLHGQHYVAFQIPVSLVFAVSSATSGLAMVTDIDIGYLDKLLAAPIRRTAVVWGRLAADLVRGLAVSMLVLAVGFAFGARVKSGVVGVVLLIVLSAAVGRRLRRHRDRHRAEDEERPDHQRVVHHLLPVAVPHAELRAARPAGRRRCRRWPGSTRSPT